MHTPAKTLYILIADLYDTSPNDKRFVTKMEFLLESGIEAVSLLAISDQGKPSFNDRWRKLWRSWGCPASAAPPTAFPT